MSVKKNSGNQAVDSTIDRGEQASYVARIRALIEQDQVAQARALLSQALEADSQDPELLSLHEVLKPPHGRTRKITDKDRSEEFEWIVANRDTYRGRWVAVEGKRLVADAPSYPEIQSRIQKLKSPPLVHRID